MLELDSVALAAQQLAFAPACNEQQLCVVELGSDIRSAQGDDTIGELIATASKPVQLALGDARTKQALSAEAFGIDDYGLAVPEDEILQRRIKVIDAEPGPLRTHRVGPVEESFTSARIEDSGLLEKDEVAAELAM